MNARTNLPSNYFQLTAGSAFRSTFATISSDMQIAGKFPFNIFPLYTIQHRYAKQFQYYILFTPNTC